MEGVWNSSELILTLQKKSGKWSPDVGDNKKFRKQIAGYSEQIEYHHWKISEELKKDVPNMERIGHWEAEIRTFEISTWKEIDETD